MLVTRALSGSSVSTTTTSYFANCLGSATTRSSRKQSIVRYLQTYKFGVSQDALDTVKATLPLVAEAGTDFTKHFYGRMFQANPQLKNLFNQTNQALGGQPKKLLKTVAVAAQAAIETGELPGDAIEGICQKHAALQVLPDHYGIVGENILGTIEDLLTKDEAVLSAWGELYGDIASVFINREEEITNEAANMPGGWRGKRAFVLTSKEAVSDTIARFAFTPVDGGSVPTFKPGKFTTIWTQVPQDGVSGPYGSYTEQPRHYTLALPRDASEDGCLSISVKRDGLVSTLLHNSTEGTEFDLSAPFGCFDLTGVEKLWLKDNTTPVVFISGGVGITPVFAMLENIYVTRPASWLHGAVNGKVHAYRDRLREIAAVREGQLIRRVWYSDPDIEVDGPPGGSETSDSLFNLAKFHYQGIMDLPKYAKEFPPDLLHLDNEHTQYYMCGPPGFMEAQKQGLNSLGVDESRIHWEGF